jgi:hypothetical protein
LEQKSPREAFGIPLYGLIERTGRDAVERGDVSIENHAMATEGENERAGVWRGQGSGFA